MAATATFQTPSFELATPQDPADPAGADSEGSDEGSGTGGSKKRKAAASGKGRRKIPIEYIADKNKRAITFSKRKAGIFTKARELSTLTGSSLLLLVVSSSGVVYTFTTEKFQPLVTQPEGKSLIAACLNGTVKSAETDEPLQETKRGGSIVLRDAFKETPNTGSTSIPLSSLPPLPTPSTSALPPLPPVPSDFTASPFVPSFRPEQLEKRNFDAFQGGDVYDQSLLNVPDEEEEEASRLRRLRRSLSLERRFEQKTQNEVPARSSGIGRDGYDFLQENQANASQHPPIASFTGMTDSWTDWNAHFNPSSSTTRDTSNARDSAFYPTEGVSAYSPHIDYLPHQEVQHNTTGPILYPSSTSGETASLSADPGPGAFDPDPDMIAQHQSNSSRPNTRSRRQQADKQAQRALSSSSTHSNPLLSPNTQGQGHGQDHYNLFFGDTQQPQQVKPAGQNQQSRPTLYPEKVSNTDNNNSNFDLSAIMNASKDAQGREDGLLSLFDRMDYSSDAFKRMLEAVHQNPEYKEMHERAMKKWEEGEGAKIREELMAAAAAAKKNGGQS